MKKIIEVLKDWIDYLSYDFLGIRSTYERIRGTIEYACFIWKSGCYREWDYAYLYNLIDFKLRRMAIQLRKDDFVQGSEDVYQEILHTLAYLQIYDSIENCEYDTSNADSVQEALDRQKKAWEDFHDSLKEHAQRWWS